MKHYEKVYHDPLLPMSSADLNAKRFKIWQSAGEAVMGFCDGDECMEGKTSIKRLGLVWLCRHCFYKMIVDYN